MLFLGIISWKSASRFNGGRGCFSDGEQQHGTNFKIKRTTIFGKAFDQELKNSLPTKY